MKKKEVSVVIQRNSWLEPSVSLYNKDMNGVQTSLIEVHGFIYDETINDLRKKEYEKILQDFQKNIGKVWLETISKYKENNK